MDVEVNWLALLLATASTMAVGSIWYMPKVFGTAWMKLAKIDQKAMAKRNPVKPLLLTLAVSFTSAYVLAHVTVLAHAYFDNSYLTDALQTAFWLWLGMTAARFITHDAFEGRPTQLTLLNVFHELATFMVMGLIIGLLHP
jgi:sterol desaturase/sphingolipid hydroxylase (fatty acid hydroxylase superfamily)